MLVGAALVVAIAGASGTAVLFSGGSDPAGDAAAQDRAASTTRPSGPTRSTTTSTTTTAPLVAPEPVPAPASLCSGGAGGTAGAVLAAMNGDRGANGLRGLCWNAQLGGIAQAWAEWMAANQTMSHQDLNAVIGSTPFTTMGENLLVGPAGLDAGSMEADWMGSGPHRANILGGYTATGVGIAAGSDGSWWVVVDFGG